MFQCRMDVYWLNVMFTYRRSKSYKSVSLRWVDCSLVQKLLCFHSISPLKVLSIARTFRLLSETRLALWKIPHTHGVLCLPGRPCQGQWSLSTYNKSKGYPGYHCSTIEIGVAVSPLVNWSLCGPGFLPYTHTHTLIHKHAYMHTRTHIHTRKLALKECHPRLSFSFCHFQPLKSSSRPALRNTELYFFFAWGKKNQ